ncbi:MAG TPA: hypothetical protein VKG43_10710 [Acidimicrobiales bacterium]|nr:hypothetical protein [Acidimicrobiales bacterium]
MSKIGNEALDAVDGAFGAGLHGSPTPSGVLILAEATVAVLTIRRWPGETHER